MLVGSTEDRASLAVLDDTKMSGPLGGSEDNRPRPTPSRALPASRSPPATGWDLTCGVDCGGAAVQRGAAPPFT